MLARRLKIAQQLLEGKGYESIIEELNVGFGTIARVSEWLKISGSGYRTVLERLDKIPEIESGSIRMSAMERRYPQYHWPQILLKEIVAGASIRQKNRLQKIIEKLPQKSRLNKELSSILTRQIKNS